MIDIRMLENQPSHQGLDSFFILISNIPFSPTRNDTKLEQLELGFSPSLATESHINFSVETPEICKQIDSIKDEICGLNKLEIRNLKEGIEKINLKPSPEKVYNQE